MLSFKMLKVIKKYFVLFSRSVIISSAHVDDLNSSQLVAAVGLLRLLTRIYKYCIRMAEYNDWDLESLREECSKRELVISSKDGVKTLAARLHTSDNSVGKVDVGVEETRG